jgi:hypothetical protein
MKSQKKHTKAVCNSRKAKDLILALEDTPNETESEECKALALSEVKVDEANAQRIEVAGKMFALYENLLCNEARTKWTTIIASQIGANPWTDLKGKVHNLARKTLVQSFDECVMFHLLIVFSQDAAEQEKYYLNVHLKKQTRDKIRHFVARVEQLNSYLGRLPGLINSTKTIKNTKQIEPFDKANLAQIILKMCPTDWQTSLARPRVSSLKTCEASWTSSKSLKTALEIKRKRDPMVVSPGKRIKVRRTKKRKVFFREERIQKKLS